MAKGDLRPEARDMLLLIMLTGMWRGEDQQLLWRHLDLNDSAITFAPGEHKAGRTTLQARVITLHPLAVAAIKRQGRSEPEDLVFTGGHGRALSINRDRVRVRRAAGLPESVVIHSLRHSLASAAAMQGMGSLEIHQVLGHARARTSERYVRWAKDRQSDVHKRAVDAALGIEPKLPVDLDVRRIRQ